jgi:hypothetical protein
MNTIERYLYRRSSPSSVPRPFLSLRLQSEAQSIEVDGLVDTGSTISVLPYDIGLALGFSWPDKANWIRLTGNMANDRAVQLVVIGHVGSFEPVPLAFAWTEKPDARVILGQINFLAYFNVCFFQSKGYFEIQPNV